MKNIIDLVKSSERVSLTDKDILDLLDSRVNIVNEINQRSWRSLEELLGKYGRFVLLVPTTSRNVGHWLCCYFDSDRNVLVYYNSYGIPIDSDTLISQFPGIHTEDGVSTLSKLIADFVRRKGCGLDVNKYQHQELKKDLATCGMHCCVRLLFCELSNDHYNSFILNKVMKPDTVVSFITLSMFLRRK